MDELDHSKAFNQFLNSPLGKELIKELEKQHDLKIGEAETARDPQVAYGKLKEAAGITSALTAIRFRAILPSGEGSNH